MDTDLLKTFSINVLEISALLFVFVGSVGVAQTKQTIRKNHPALGRFRRFSSRGVSFFAQDKEELPFNRVVGISQSIWTLEPDS